MTLSPATVIVSGLPVGLGSAGACARTYCGASSDGNSALFPPGVGTTSGFGSALGFGAGAAGLTSSSGVLVPSLRSSSARPSAMIAGLPLSTEMTRMPGALVAAPPTPGFSPSALMYPLASRIWSSVPRRKIPLAWASMNSVPLPPRAALRVAAVFSMSSTFSVTSSARVFALESPCDLRSAATSVWSAG